MSRILVIDDDHMVRHTLRVVLERASYHVYDAPNGVEGLQDFQEYAPDLVITDIVMPRKDGLDTIRELVRLRPCLKLIAITGSDPEGRHGFLELASGLGAAKTFPKPFDVNELVETIRELLNS